MRRVAHGSKTYGTFFSTITEEDLREIREESERLIADPVARRELFTRIGFYDKNGNVAKPFRHLVEETE